MFNIPIIEMNMELTNEILKQNGFTLVAVGDNSIGTPKKNMNRFEKWECNTQFQTFNVFYDRVSRRYALNFGGNHIEGIKTVEKLNLAMKVCEILKEIEITTRR